MGRCFSTGYRFIIVAVSVSAVVLSILSATSCAFVQFKHEYKEEARFLLDSGVTIDAPPANGDARGGGGGDWERGLADNVTAPGLTDSAMDEVVATAAKIDEETAIGEGEAASTAAAPEAATEAPPTTEATEATTEATEATTKATEATTKATEATTEATEATTEATAAAITTEATTKATDLTLVGENEDVPVSAPAEDAVATDLPTPAPILDDAETFSPAPTPARIVGDPTRPINDFGVPAPGSSEQFNSEPEAERPEEAVAPVAATASGDAGLYCEGARDFSVTNLWGQSVEELAEDLGDMSDFNQSEEIARGSAVAACVVGVVLAFVLVLESLVGWRMCCERWIVGFFAIVACFTQGLTFLFFNSERYCDGDIVNEILNQEPCVVGQGGLFSAIATACYFIAAIMACRLPTDDPYGMCCKERSAARHEARNRDGGGSGVFGRLSKSDDKRTFVNSSDDGPDTASSPEDRDRPNWLPKNDSSNDDENEVI